MEEKKMKGIIILEEMPERCWDCPCFDDLDWTIKCGVTNMELDLEKVVVAPRPKLCPIFRLTK